MPSQEDVDVLKGLLELSQAPEVMTDGAKPFVVIPKENKVVPLDHLMPRPSRKSGCPVFVRADAFCAYVNQQKNASSRLYVTCATNIVAILNHHGEADPGWADHKAQLTLTQTPEWTIWKGSNGGSMDQRTFAQFIDDNSGDISGMDGASLLELIRTLKASQKLEITGEVDEKNDVTGSSFTLAARTKAGAKDDVELPAEFGLSIAPYEGGEKVPVLVRLRIEIRAPKFFLNYDLVKVQKVESEALKGIVAGVAKEVAMEAWFGIP